MSSAITRVLKKATYCMEYKRENLLLSIQKSESYMNGQYVAGIEQLERQDVRNSFIFWTSRMDF